MNLYDLTTEYAAVQQAAEEGGDLLALLDQIEGSIEAKGGGIVRVLRNLEADAASCKAEADRFYARRKAAENSAERLREYVKTCMQRAGINKIQGPTFAITIAAGQDRVEVHDAGALKAAAPELVRVETTEAPDKRAILARYKADGEVLPGCEYVPTTTLRVR